MRKHLTEVLKYFAFFSYAPSLREIHTFFPIKITQKNLRMLLIDECKQGRLMQLSKAGVFQLSKQVRTRRSTLSARLIFPKYTLPQYSMSRESKVESQKSKVTDRRIQIYLNILKIFPLVQFVGITGSSAVKGLRNNDDIDLFIITKGGYIWTTRFIVVLLAKLLKIHGGSGVCLNLFFDESNLTITKIKQNSYIAHEILQMKPIIDKKNIYSAFIAANEWVFKIFPNSRSVIPTKVGIQESKLYRSRVKHGMTMTNNIEKFYKSIQLPIIMKNKTSFMITSTQLWLFRHDFEKKLKRRGLGR